MEIKEVTCIKYTEDTNAFELTFELLLHFDQLFSSNLQSEVKFVPIM